ncbi:hypothetical protein EVAR_53595_1 [Eumeta japonica]|uniref:Uncharacterized protein n=1 Tax=Eumeta variegata TaxID=151549 RepID=A0A4C1X2G1_EUMVA|nr:hypothetical protein EVAR_53595_1 [Eumeta japonica]
MRTQSPLKEFVTLCSRLTSEGVRTHSVETRPPPPTGRGGGAGGARPARRRPLKGEDTNFLSSLKEGSFQEVEKSYNRKGNLRFKSSNEAGNFLMEGRKAVRELRKNLLVVIASSVNRAAAGRYL